MGAGQLTAHGQVDPRRDSVRHNVDKLNSRRWKLARREALDRDGWRCRKCGKAGRLQVDHIQPLSDGGAPYDLVGLQTLCVSCHIDKTWSERGVTAEQVAWRRYQRGMLLSSEYVSLIVQ